MRENVASFLYNPCSYSAFLATSFAPALSADCLGVGLGIVLDDQILITRNVGNIDKVDLYKGRGNLLRAIVVAVVVARAGVFVKRTLYAIV
jgi:hypothetical protein